MIGFLIAFLVVAFGMKFFHHLSLYVVGVIIGGVVILNLVLTFASHAGFVRSWNAQAAKYHSVTYQAFTAAAGKAAGCADAPHLELGRHLRRHGRRLHAGHLGLRHRLRRR